LFGIAGDEFDIGGGELIGTDDEKFSIKPSMMSWRRDLVVRSNKSERWHKIR
jgi:hypothetical protein